MPTIKNSPFSDFTLIEEATPDNPASGQQKVFIASSDNHLKRVNSSGAVVDIEGGGSGNATFESAYASPPASPAEGDLWLITDGLLHARYTGAAWSYYYGTQKVTKPVLGDFGTWVNQGSATLDDYGQLNLYVPTGGAGDGNNRGKVMAAPSLPYTINAIILPGLVPVANMGVYLCWSDGTKFVRYGIGNTQTSNTLEVEVDKWNTSTAYNSNYDHDAYIGITAPGSAFWLRIQEDNTNRTCLFSMDGGKHFHQYHQIGRTDFLTATQIGFIAWVGPASAYSAVPSLLSWAQS